ncbi:MAG TPA: GAF and ANTAR domain-containing protein [Kribbella sp.]|nr:GAF and ANTAR domain-containing protein [Kribbella sp.]
MESGSGPVHLARVMTEVAASLQTPMELSETLELITRAAADTIPGVDEVSVSVTTREQKIETLAPTHPLTTRADELQVAFGEGPCLEAALEEPVLACEDLAADPRWPRYGPAAAELGFGAQLAFQFRADPNIRGALNLYSWTSHGIDPEVWELGALFAGQIALAMGWARHTETLHQALATRNLIGQAIGIVMERYRLDPDRAFAFLVRTSQAGNIKVHDVAQGIVDQVIREADR